MDRFSAALFTNIGDRDEEGLEPKHENSYYLSIYAAIATTAIIVVTFRAIILARGSYYVSATF